MGAGWICEQPEWTFGGVAHFDPGGGETITHTATKTLPNGKTETESSKTTITKDAGGETITRTGTATTARFAAPLPR